MSATGYIPPNLRSKIPQQLIVFHQYRWFFIVVSIGAIFFSLCFGGGAGYDIFRYLLIPFLCPWVSIIYFFVKPKNPYQGTTLVFSDNLNGLERKDEDAKHLVDIYRSWDAHRFLLNCAATLSVGLIIVMNIVAVLQWRILHWTSTLNESRLGARITLCLIFSFVLIGTIYVNWGFKTWLNSYKDNLSNTW